jgi:hypothetical protein
VEVVSPVDIPGAGSLADIAANALAQSARSAAKTPCASCKFALAKQADAESQLQAAREDAARWRERNEEHERLISTTTGATVNARQLRTIKTLQEIDVKQRRSLDAAEERVLELMQFIVDAGLKIPPIQKRVE